MLSLLLTLLIVGVTLGVVLTAGALFLQGYFYTEASPGILWQGPATAAILTLFLFFWCWLDFPRAGSVPGVLPYDTLLRFSPEVRLKPTAVDRFTSVDKQGNKRSYGAKKITQGTGNTITQYFLEPEKTSPWKPSGVTSIIIEHEGKTYEFTPRRGEDNDNPYFISPEGWVMMQYETGVTGLPRMFSFWRFLANVLLNFAHMALWFVCLWLLLRFQWAHALGLAFVLWLTVSVFVLPALLSQVAALPAA